MAVPPCTGAFNCTGYPPPVVPYTTLAYTVDDTSTKYFFSDFDSQCPACASPWEPRQIAFRGATREAVLCARCCFDAASCSDLSAPYRPDRGNRYSTIAAGCDEWFVPSREPGRALKRAERVDLECLVCHTSWEQVPASALPGTIHPQRAGELGTVCVCPSACWTTHPDDADSGLERDLAAVRTAAAYGLDAGAVDTPAGLVLQPSLQPAAVRTPTAGDSLALTGLFTGARPDMTLVQGGTVAGPAALGAAVVALVRAELGLEVLNSRFAGAGSASCTGTLLTPVWVLTAAHCVTAARAPYVAAAAPRLGDQGAQLRAVADVVVHPAHRRDSLDHDIALVRLDAPVNATAATLDTIGVLAFALQQQPGPARFLPVIAAGYGAGVLSDGRTLPPGTLTWLVDESGRFRVVDRARCVLVEGAGPAGTVCGGFDQGTRNTCAGDSGGPVFEAATGVLVAITSAAHTASSLCVRTAASPGRLPALGRYTAIAPYLDWVLTHIPADQLRPPAAPPAPARPGPPAPASPDRQRPPRGEPPPPPAPYEPPESEAPRSLEVPPHPPAAGAGVQGGGAGGAVDTTLAACGLVLAVASLVCAVWVAVGGKERVEHEARAEERFWSQRLD